MRQSSCKCEVEQALLLVDTPPIILGPAPALDPSRQHHSNSREFIPKGHLWHFAISLSSNGFRPVIPITKGLTCVP